MSFQKNYKGGFGNEEGSYAQLLAAYLISTVALVFLDKLRKGLMGKENMINDAILVCTATLSVAMFISAIKVRQIVKNEDPNQIRAFLFLRYDIFKQKVLFIIDGFIVIFFIQIANIVFGIQGSNHLLNQILIITSLICILIIGYNFVYINYSFVHINQAVRNSYKPTRYKFERWICGDD